MKTHAKFKVDDRWDENPFIVYKRDNEKTRVNFVQHNILQLKRSESADRRTAMLSRHHNGVNSVDDHPEESKMMTMNELKLDLIKVNDRSDEKPRKQREQSAPSAKKKKEMDIFQ